MAGQISQSGLTALLSQPPCGSPCGDQTGAQGQQVAQEKTGKVVTRLLTTVDQKQLAPNGRVSARHERARSGFKSPLPLLQRRRIPPAPIHGRKLAQELSRRGRRVRCPFSREWTFGAAKTRSTARLANLAARQRPAQAHTSSRPRRAAHDGSLLRARRRLRSGYRPWTLLALQPLQLRRRQVLKCLLLLRPPLVQSPFTAPCSQLTRCSCQGTASCASSAFESQPARATALAS